MSSFEKKGKEIDQSLGKEKDGLTVLTRTYQKGFRGKFPILSLSSTKTNQTT